MGKCRTQEGKDRRKRLFNAIKARFFAVFTSVYVGILGYTAWVVQSPPGTFTYKGHAQRVLPALISPFFAYGIYEVIKTLQNILDRYTDAQIRSHENKLRKSLSELKDSTRYQRTQQLLEKYDPDWLPPAAASGVQATNESLTSRQKGQLKTVVSGAGSRLSVALGHLWSQAAQTLIADDPTLIAALQQAQAQASQLEKENAELRKLLGLHSSSSPQGFGSPIATSPATSPGTSPADSRHPPQEAVPSPPYPANLTLPTILEESLTAEEGEEALEANVTVKEEEQN